MPTNLKIGTVRRDKVRNYKHTGGMISKEALSQWEYNVSDFHRAKGQEYLVRQAKRARQDLVRLLRSQNVYRIPKIRIFRTPNGIRIISDFIPLHVLRSQNYLRGRRNKAAFFRRKRIPRSYYQYIEKGQHPIVARINAPKGHPRHRKPTNLRVPAVRWFEKYI